MQSRHLCESVAPPDLSPHVPSFSFPLPWTRLYFWVGGAWSEVMRKREFPLFFQLTFFSISLTESSKLCGSVSWWRMVPLLSVYKYSLGKACFYFVTFYWEHALPGRRGRRNGFIGSHSDCLALWKWSGKQGRSSLSECVALTNLKWQQEARVVGHSGGTMMVAQWQKVGQPWP